MPECQKYKVLMAAIRRVNLDTFWSREHHTVMKNRSYAKKILSMSSMVGLDGPFVSFQPMPLCDHCGYEIVISMVLASRRPGKYSKSYTRFDTVRQLRGCFSNFEKTSAHKILINWVLESATGAAKELSKITTSSV